MIWVVVFWTICFEVARQAVHYPMVCTIYVLDGENEVGDVLPPSCVATRQVRLSLKVFEALVIGNYDKFSS